MSNKVLNSYKIPLLLSFTLFVVLIAIRVEREALSIALIFLGSILGGLLLELDYFIYAHFFEPEKDFSKQIQGYTKHKDYKGALNYIAYHRNDIKDKILNSAIFQVVLAGLTIVIVGSPVNVFLKALVISALVNSMYRMSEEYVEGRIDSWFWALKNKPTKNGFYIYSFFLVLALMFSLSVFA